MLRLRGQEGMERYSLLIDEQLVIGWDNLLRGKFSKQWKIQQKSYLNRKRLNNLTLYGRKLRKKKREEEKHKSKDNTKDKKKKNKTEVFHSFYQSIVPFIKEM
jgi:hypothetical protein